MSDLVSKLKAALEGVTPGPWECDLCDDHRPIVCTPGDIICHADPNHGAGGFLPDRADVANFNYIALCSPENITTLIAALEAAEARIEAGWKPVDTHAEFEIWQDEQAVAGTSGPREAAFTDAMHYAMIYGQYGPVEVFEVVRTKIAPPEPGTGNTGGKG